MLRNITCDLERTKHCNRAPDELRGYIRGGLIETEYK